jgi:type IV pilus assembly protein PilN
VILINLLPHREEKRKQRKRAFFASLAASAAVGAVAVFVWYSVLQQMTAAQESRNAFLKAEIERLDTQIKDIATLRMEIDALKARQKAVEDLQADRNVPVHLLNEITRQTPEGVYINSIRQNGQVVLITGIAQTNERVSEFLRNALYNSQWLEKPELIEIKASAAQTVGREQRRLFDFSMRVTLKRQQSAPPPLAASGAATNVNLPGAGTAGKPATPGAVAPAAKSS